MEPPPELMDRLITDFPAAPRSEIERLVQAGWSRTDASSPPSHRVAVTERFVRLTLREGR